MSFSLYDYIKLFLTNKKIILFSTLIALIISILIAFFVIKPEFLSTGTIKANGKSGGLSNLLAVGGLGDIGGLEELTGGSASGELALFENIVYSRRCLEELIFKYDLMNYYNYKYLDDAIKFVREELIELSKDTKASTMSIGFYDENPQKSKEITEFLINSLVKINSEINIENAKNNKEFIEARYLSTQEELKKSEDSLEVFQNIYGISPDISVKASVQAEIQIESQLKTEEVKLDILKQILSPDQPEIKQQQEKINLLYQKLNEIKNSDVGSGNLSLKGSPEIVMKFLRLQRDVEIYNKILAFLIPVYENAKIEEKKEEKNIIILDKPFLPEKKKRPKRIVIVLIITGLTFSSAYFYFVIKEKINSSKLT